MSKSRPYNREISRRWYLKMKLDPVRYQIYLDRNKAWNAAYRHSGSKKYEKLLERRRLHAELNPFPKRAKAFTYYQELKADPVAYKAMLAKKRLYYLSMMAKLRADPLQYKAYLNDRMVYHRYYRIVNRAVSE